MRNIMNINNLVVEGKKGRAVEYHKGVLHGIYKKLMEVTKDLKMNLTIEDKYQYGISTENAYAVLVVELTDENGDFICYHPVTSALVVDKDKGYHISPMRNQFGVENTQLLYKPLTGNLNGDLKIMGSIQNGYVSVASQSMFSQYELKVDGMPANVKLEVIPIGEEVKDELEDSLNKLIVAMNNYIDAYAEQAVNPKEFDILVELGVVKDNGNFIEEARKYAAGLMIETLISNVFTGDVLKKDKSVGKDNRSYGLEEIEPEFDEDYYEEDEWEYHEGYEPAESCHECDEYEGDDCYDIEENEDVESSDRFGIYN